ncbi:MAG: GAD-like domain-containing protein, partial [Bacteroidota bacterium]|nr:GAD-like domain-containing protein [Bacteroidota bacterium]
METIQKFIDRNKDSYIKHADVPQELITKYKGILPDELTWLWENMGFGIYENGYLQLVNPEEWD